MAFSSMNSGPSLIQWNADRERLLLAPYAMHAEDSQGRDHDESEHPYRSVYQRDRDRIVHSAAFRRLSGKMQVFTGERGDYHRTRLTHTQEVASIARTIGRALMLNEDLIEALALVHDIGHPPYGHAGEDALNECLEGNGGFSHNQFALTIVTDLEIRYQAFPGLNLTKEVLEGQSKRIDKNAPGLKPLLEVQLVDAADSTTYDAHDTDDAVKLGLVTLDEMAENELIRECLAFVRREHTALDDDLLRKEVVHKLVDCQVNDILHETASELENLDFKNTAEVKESPFVIGPSAELAEKKAELEQFLYQRVYRHPELIAVRTRAQERLQVMFEGYRKDPNLFPKKYQLRADRVGPSRMAAEYIAGMTDRFCEDRFREHFSK